MELELSQLNFMHGQPLAVLSKADHIDTSKTWDLSYSWPNALGFSSCWIRHWSLGPTGTHSEQDHSWVSGRSDQAPFPSPMYGDFSGYCKTCAYFSCDSGPLLWFKSRFVLKVPWDHRQAVRQWLDYGALQLSCCWMVGPFSKSRVHGCDRRLYLPSWLPSSLSASWTSWGEEISTHRAHLLWCSDLKLDDCELKPLEIMILNRFSSIKLAMSGIVSAMKL